MSSPEATARFWAERIKGHYWDEEHRWVTAFRGCDSGMSPEAYLSDHRTCARAFRWVLDCLDRRWWEAMRDPSRALADLADLAEKGGE